MTKWQQRWAYAGWLLFWALGLAEVLNRVKGLYEAPGTVVTAWGGVRSVFSQLNDVGILFFALGAICLAVATSTLWLPSLQRLHKGSGLRVLPQKQREVAAMGDNYNNHGNNYGHMGPINFGSRPRTLSAADKQTILDRVPLDKPVYLEYAGNDVEVERLADQVRAFLKESGYAIESDIVHVFSSRAIVGFTVDIKPDKSTIQIGHQG